jgi:myo-inositol-1(or 4)-monophosphatase
VTTTAATTSDRVRDGRGVSRWTVELGLARELAVRAGELQMDRYERVERIHHKSARDVVTEVDHLSEELILDAIKATFPGDAILAEETGAHTALDEAGSSGRTWVVDPLDGTINYANGIPFFCVSIGLVAEGRSVVGVVLDPSRNDLFEATADGPALLRGAPIRASEKDKLSDFVMAMALSGRSAASRARAIRKEIRISRSMGSAALSLAYVANGRFDACVQTTGLSPWDVVAAGLIAERAGATVTDLSGGTWLDLERKPGRVGVLAAPAAHYPKILAIVGEASASRTSRSAGATPRPASGAAAT